ncbi:hypothetical protein ACIS_00147 [Anaplasma centrale str. Israel]|uniref:Uncharacterized protein n=1 Tax=Anaplasma centrale (strain Israel) TaxID=574556 RepID=D1ATG4_ANACI|nr:hypothetical protein ACIS_00147 [Anaplasma centrale str. Israel]
MLGWVVRVRNGLGAVGGCTKLWGRLSIRPRYIVTAMITFIWLFITAGSAEARVSDMGVNEFECESSQS